MALPVGRDNSADAVSLRVLCATVSFEYNSPLADNSSIRIGKNLSASAKLADDKTGAGVLAHARKHDMVS